MLKVKKVHDGLRGLDFDLVEATSTPAALCFHHEEGKKHVLPSAIRIAGNL
jgi:hypothetical protein